MSYELQGTVKEVLETQTFNSGFTKRDFVVTINEDDRYPQHIKLQVVKDRCSWLDTYSAGDKVKVTFDLRGSEYKGRYYTDLQAYKIEKTEAGGGAAPSDGGSPPPEFGG